MASLKFQNALKGKNNLTPPIWFMRQAGRYHSHYQKLKAENTFEDLCKNPSLAAEVAMGPIEEFDFDVAILFSDLLFPLEAMGMGLRYRPGPQLDWLVDPTTIKHFAPPKNVKEYLGFQEEALRQTRNKLSEDKSIIGFVGGPFTLFSYAVEGSHQGGLINTKKHFSLFKEFWARIKNLMIENIQLQFDGGAEVVMIFDTAAGELPPDIYKDL